MENYQYEFIKKEINNDKKLQKSNIFNNEDLFSIKNSKMTTN